MKLQINELTHVEVIARILPRTYYLSLFLYCLTMPSVEIFEYRLPLGSRLVIGMKQCIDVSFSDFIKGSSLNIFPMYSFSYVISWTSIYT